MERQRGIVKWFSREKGWGFIRLDSGEEIFVHHSDIEGEGFVSLEDDQPVEFVVEEMEKGPRARHVREVGGAPPGQADAGAPAHEAGVGPRQTRRGGRRERKEQRAEVSGARRAEAPSDPESSGADGSSDRGQRRPPLAEQLRRRLGSLFPGLDG